MRARRSPPAGAPAGPGPAAAAAAATRLRAARQGAPACSSWHAVPLAQPRTPSPALLLAHRIPWLHRVPACPAPASAPASEPAPTPPPPPQAHVLLRGGGPVGRPHHRPGHRVLHIQPLHARAGGRRGGGVLAWVDLGCVAWAGWWGAGACGVGGCWGEVTPSVPPRLAGAGHPDPRLPMRPSPILLSLPPSQLPPPHQPLPAPPRLPAAPRRMWPTRAAPAPPPTSSLAWLWATSLPSSPASSSQSPSSPASPWRT